MLQLSPLTYKNPTSLPDGGVLVVGASSSGLQIASELRRAGRDVVLAVGRHTRLPRRYRGSDVLRWLDRLGTFDRTLDDLPPERARSEPSLQLVGGEQDLDLGRLHRMGVQLTGRFVGIDGFSARFAADLPAYVDDAERRLRRVLARIDTIAGGTPRTPVAPITVPAGETEVDLASRGIHTVVWATGFRGSWPWLHLPVVTNGRIVQYRGRTVVPGLYTVGQRFQHRRGSTLIDGARHDVHDVVADLLEPVPSAFPLRDLARAV